MSEDDGERPHLRVVASTESPGEGQAARDERAVRREISEEEIAYYLRKHAANVLRVVRGAGSPYKIYRECCDLIERFHAYHDDFGQLPPIHLIERELAIDISNDKDPLSEREWAFETMVKGSLQLAAATLLDQRLQISAGETELVKGVRMYEKYTDERRAQWDRKHPSSVKKRVAKPSRKQPKETSDDWV